jgi:hypothetical protein
MYEKKGAQSIDCVRDECVFNEGHEYCSLNNIKIKKIVEEDGDEKAVCGSFVLKD